MLNNLFIKGFNPNVYRWSKIFYFFICYFIFKGGVNALNEPSVVSGRLIHFEHILFLEMKFLSAWKNTWQHCMLEAGQDRSKIRRCYLKKTLDCFQLQGLCIT